MDADATEDSPLPGYSLPIRAPLTIDSDSEFYLSINDNIYSSFNSSSRSSSIDISSYGDEHTSIFEVYPDEEIVIKGSHVEESCFIRPFVRYPDANHVKDSRDVSDSTVFRPFVKIPCEESSGGGFGVKPSVPIAPLTGDSDSDTDVDSVDGFRDSSWIPADGIVQKVTTSPKVRSFSDDEGDHDVDNELQAEGVFSGKVECLNEVVKFSESAVYSFDLERIDSLTVSSSNNEIEIERKLSEADELSFSEIEILSSVSTEGCKVECLNEVLKLSGSDASSFDLERINARTVSSSKIDNETKIPESDELSFNLERIDAQLVPNSNNEIENVKSVKLEGCKVDHLNEVVKLSELDASSLDSERIDTQTVSSSNNENEIEIIHEKLSGSNEASFDSKRTDSQVALNSDSEIETLSSVSTDSIANEICNVEHLTEVVKLSELDASSQDLERIKAQTASSSNNEIKIEPINMKPSEPDESDSQNVSNADSVIEIKTINESEQEVVSKKKQELLKEMQRVRIKFLRLAFNEQLTTKVNGEGSNYNFDFALTILAIGKTGVGKSATINSIFGENKAVTNAFNPGTTTIQEITGNVDGIQLKVIDTPGLQYSSSDRLYNLKVLNSIKRYTRKHTPNVVLYVDRLDTHDVNDSHLLKMITSSLGSSVWHRCIIALTHAGCEPSKGLVVRRCRFLQEQICSFGGNNRSVANPVWLVDNHPSYKHVMDLGCDLKGLICLDQADEDDGCDEVQASELLSGPQNVMNRSRVRRNADYMENGGSVKLVVNSTGWSLEFPLNVWSLGS